MNTSDCINQIKERLAALEAFSKAYPEIPDCFIFTADLTEKLRFHMNFCYRDDRDELLNSIGDCFGKTGWVATRCGEDYNWEKVILGVTIRLYSVTSIPVEPPRPVDPKEFPLLLGNNNGVELEVTEIERVTE